MDQNSLEAHVRQLTALIDKLTSNSSQTPKESSKENFISIPLPLFYGRSGDNARGWVRRVDTIFEAMKIPEERKVVTAASYLRDAADQWYQSTKFGKGAPKEWQDFANKLITAFEPGDYQMSLCNQLATVMI
ncbi:uncharacterized protein VTP21DRAFT_10266 [Calcarisporiella thermophila]|uniref:uncharacterized protein n=1 Tax=Calcarisporiella thermophila TaxID=911321 RepID=UPI003742C62C